jgi:hypothetical protein
VVQQVSNVVAPTLGAYAGEYLRNVIGGNFIDVLQIQGGAAPIVSGSSATTQSSLRDYFAGARLGGEKQLSNNLFLSFSAGLCSLSREYLQNGNQSAVGGFVEALGGNLEYRFNPHLSLKAGTDPPTSALYCGRTNLSLGTVVQTPRQWGLSLLRSWHF